MSDTARQYLAFANALADAAHPVVLGYFRQRVPVERKLDFSPVTNADREVEQLLRDMIAKRCPEHGVIGEEFGSTAGHGTFTWVLDPIDGTKSFITGKPLFGTLVALLQDERPLLGVIDMPALNERWLGARGAPTTMNGAPCSSSEVQELGSATLYATSPDMFEGRDSEAFDALSRRIRFRCFGADCYAYAMLASGHTELVVEADMQPYDYMALVPVIEGAGGVITDWAGAPLTLASDGRVVAAANRTLHAAALEVLGA